MPLRRENFQKAAVSGRCRPRLGSRRTLVSSWCREFRVRALVVECGSNLPRVDIDGRVRSCAGSPYFSLRVAASIPINELRVEVSTCIASGFWLSSNCLFACCFLQGLVQEQFTRLSPYRKQVDGELQLCFDDRMLDDEETFSSYLPGGTISSSAKPAEPRDSTGRHRQPPWPKPFAGEVFVVFALGTRDPFTNFRVSYPNIQESCGFCRGEAAAAMGKWRKSQAIERNTGDDTSRPKSPVNLHNGNTKTRQQ